MPSATPISRSVELVPLALALSSGRMLASTAVDEGANTRPMPMPARMNAGSMVVYGTVADMLSGEPEQPGRLEQQAGHDQGAGADAAGEDAGESGRRPSAPASTGW